jgi:hypothetical protein
MRAEPHTPRATQSRHIGTMSCSPPLHFWIASTYTIAYCTYSKMMSRFLASHLTNLEDVIKMLRQESHELYYLVYKANAGVRLMLCVFV